MQTTGVVRWFDRSTGIGVVALDDGGSDCVVVRVERELAACASVVRAPRGAPADDGGPDLAEAVRAGTWGDGGRDY